MSDTIINIFLCLFIFWVGVQIGRVHTVYRIAKEVTNQLETTDSEEVYLHFEKHHHAYYAFSKENRFLAQGSNFFELMVNLKNRFPDYDFRVTKDQEHLSEEEVTQMVEAIFKVFGEDRTSIQEKA